jgi:DNA-binding transcriptional LysR family regulator
LPRPTNTPLPITCQYTGDKGMDFTALRYFCETANARSIRAASERLHVSPSAISRQIAKLEHELRAPIFDRRARGMALTSAGAILQTRVEGMMREFERVKSHVAALQDIQIGTVDIYGFQAAAGSIVGPVLNELHLRYPNILFNFLASSTDETIEGLTNGSAEVGLVLNPPVRDAIQNTEIYRDEIVVAFGPRHPLARRKVVALREVAAFSMVLAVPSFGLRQQVERALDRQGIRPNVFCVTNSLSLMKDLAGFGDQCALLPRSAVMTEVSAGTLATAAVRELAEDPMVFCVCVLKGRMLSPAAKVFVNAVIAHCRRHGVHALSRSRRKPPAEGRR